MRDLVREAGGDIRLAEHGIVYVDEIDKIASASSLHGPDVSRTGVQRALLKPMEETDVELRVAHDMVSQMEALAGLAAHRQAREEDRQHAQHPLHPQRRLHRPRRDRQAAAHALGHRFPGRREGARRRAAVVVPAPGGPRGSDRLRLRVGVRRPRAGDGGARPADRGGPLRDPAQPELPGHPGKESRLQGLRHRRALRGRGAAQTRDAGPPAAHRRPRPRERGRGGAAEVREEAPLDGHHAASS